MRETGPVSRRLSSLQGEGGDYESEIRYQAIARTILGGLKNRLRLGGVAVGSARQVMADGTVINVSTILGVGGAADIDSVRITQPAPPPSPAPLPVEKEKRYQQPRLLGIYMGVVNFDFGTSKFFSVDVNVHTEKIYVAGAQSSTYSFLAANPNTLCTTSRTANQPTRFFDRDWNLIHSVNLPNAVNGLVSIDGVFYLASNLNGVYSIATMSEAGELVTQFTTNNVIRSFTRDDDGFVWTVENDGNLGVYVARQYDRSGALLLSAPLATSTPAVYPIAVSDDAFYVAGTSGDFALRLTLFRHAKSDGRLLSQLDLGARLTNDFSPGPLAWFDGKVWMGTGRNVNVSATNLITPAVHEFSPDLSSRIIHLVPLESLDNQADIASLTVDEYAALPIDAQTLDVLNTADSP